MSAPATIDRDDIRLFLPGIGEEEYAARAKLRSLRNAATGLISSTDSDTARALAWHTIEYATGALFAPGAAASLADLNKLCQRFMLTAMLAEQIDAERFAQ